MEIYFSKSLVIPKSVIAIGTFDGVHRGHKTVLQKLVNMSQIEMAPSVVYTFDPPPKSYFQGVPVLTSIDEKISRIKQLGIDYLKVASFDKQYLQRTVDDFLEELGQMNPVNIIVGNDFRFGYKRAGDVDLLRQHFNVTVIEPVCCTNGEKISSTRIRKLIQEGKTEQANLLLDWRNKEAEILYT